MLDALAALEVLGDQADEIVEHFPALLLGQECCSESAAAMSRPVTGLGALGQAGGHCHAAIGSSFARTMRGEHPAL